MGFSCECELRVRGGTAEERRSAADILLSAAYILEEGSGRSESPDFLRLTFGTMDGLPEEELELLWQQFPALSLVLSYVSMDGEFFGMSSRDPEGAANESEDFDEGTREEIGRRFDGNALAFVRSRYSLDEDR